MLRFGHRRSRSGNQNQSEASNPNLALVKETSEKEEQVARKKSVPDLFSVLETVWSSLECWFDLVKSEVEKIQKGLDLKDTENSVSAKIGRLSVQRQTDIHSRSKVGLISFCYTWHCTS